MRKLLVVGACSALAARKGHNDALRRWASGMLERKTVKYKFKRTAVALANKLARIVYALATKGGHYDDGPRVVCACAREEPSLGALEPSQPPSPEDPPHTWGRTRRGERLRVRPD